MKREGNNVANGKWRKGNCPKRKKEKKKERQQKGGRDKTDSEK